MFLPHYLLFCEFIHITPYLSDSTSSLLDYVVDDFNNVVFNNYPEDIAHVWKVFECAAAKGEPLPSDPK
jgi:hypothetical protein